MLQRLRSTPVRARVEICLEKVEMPGKERGGMISAQLCKGKRGSSIGLASQVTSLGSGHVALWDDCRLSLLVTLYEGADSIFLDKKCSLNLLRSATHGSETHFLGSLSLPIGAMANEGRLARRRSESKDSNASVDTSNIDIAASSRAHHQTRLLHMQATSSTGRSTDIFCDLNVSVSFGDTAGEDASPACSETSMCTATSFDDAAFGALKLHVIEMEDMMKELNHSHQKKDMQLSKAKSRIADLKNRLERALEVGEKFSAKVVAQSEATVAAKISDTVNNEDPPSQVALAVLRIENSRLRFQLLEAQDALLSANSMKSPGKNSYGTTPSTAGDAKAAPEALTGSSDERTHSSDSAGYALIHPFIHPSSSSSYLAVNGVKREVLSDVDADDESYYFTKSTPSVPGNPLDSSHSSEINSDDGSDTSDLGWCDGGMSALFPSPAKPTSHIACQTDQKCRFLDLATGAVTITGADTTFQEESVHDTSAAILVNLNTLSMQLETKMSEVTILEDQIHLLRERSKSEARERHKKEKEKMLVLEAHMLECKTELRSRGDMVDEERAKVHALKQVLMRLTRYFSAADKRNLYEAGVILTDGVVV